MVFKAKNDLGLIDNSDNNNSISETELLEALSSYYGGVNDE